MSNVQRLLVNSMVYQDCQSRTVQADLVAEVAALGADGIEIRREYLSPVPEVLHDELVAISRQAVEAGLDVFYSVPESLFIKGEASPLLGGFLSEAATLGALNVKMNIGGTEDGIKNVGSLVEILRRASSRVTIENDQTLRNGRLDVVSGLLRDLRTANVPLGYTFDVGNWLWAGVDPLAAAQELGRYATVFHLKDIDRTGGLHATLLDEGEIDWRSALAEIETDVPVVLEYPIPDRATRARELATVREALNERTRK